MASTENIVAHGDPPRPAPRVFISYSHESEQHKSDVRQFCALLREHGIDAMLDYFDNDQRHDWYAWMIKHITESDFTIVIASPRYASVADGAGPATESRGVHSESALLRDLLYRDREQWIRKTLPVILPGGSRDDIPHFLQPYCADHYQVSELTEAGIEDLLRVLTGQPRYVPSELGDVPALPPIDSTLPSAAAAPMSNLPLDNRAFTGRAQEVARLVDIVTTAADGDVLGATILSIDGMPGVGKTTFAVHVAHHLASRFPDGQFFLDLHGHTPGKAPVEPADALLTLLLTIGIAVEQIPATLDERSRLWREKLAGKRVLLLLDDALRPEQVRPLLPGCPGSLLLVTSRRRMEALEDVQPLSLEVLVPDDAVAMLHRVARVTPDPSEATAAAELVRLCGYLPLAIALTAGRWRSHPTWTVRHLAEELARSRNRPRAIRAGNQTVAAAFDLSYRDLTPDQQRLFRRMSQHPGAHIDVYAAAVLDDADVEDTRERLEALYLDHLLEEPTPGTYRLHDLINAYAVTLATGDSVALRESAIDRLVDYYLYATVTAVGQLPTRHIANLAVSPKPPAQAPDLSSAEAAAAWLANERANIGACVIYAANHGRAQRAAQLATAIHPYLRQQGHWNHALCLHKTAVTAAYAASQFADEAAVLADVGVIHYLRGEYDEAAKSLTRAHNLFSMFHNRIGEANTRTDLGILQYLRGDFTDAETSLVRARALYVRLGHRLGEANALKDLGIVQRLRGDYAEAVGSFTDALTLYTELGNQVGEATVLADLGMLQYLRGHYDDATASLTRAHTLYTQLGHRLGEANALIDLGNVQRLRGKFADATASLTRAHALYVQLGHRLGEANALKDLGMVQHATHDYPEALKSFTRAHVLLTDDREGQVENLINLAALAVDWPQAGNPREHYEQALHQAQQIGARLYEAYALEGIGRCLLRTRDASEEGISRLRQASVLYEQLGVPEALAVEHTLAEISG
ncbi:tetratricopeptide repeat protein [Kibdelosporangium aridum]|uniref:tetratricopeptide repeat protein n=1 Tax=Kibdelosporangium aridum TaxID=2030 RepID=UPI0035EC48C4